MIDKQENFIAPTRKQIANCYHRNSMTVFAGVRSLPTSGA